MSFIILKRGTHAWTARHARSMVAAARTGHVLQRVIMTRDDDCPTHMKFFFLTGFLDVTFQVDFRHQLINKESLEIVNRRTVL